MNQIKNSEQPGKDERAARAGTMAGIIVIMAISLVCACEYISWKGVTE